jgi:hypothetical protein
MRLPTGSIDEVGDTPRNGSGTLERLPYTMQLGSGTYDFAVFDEVQHPRHASTGSITPVEPKSPPFFYLL